METRCELIRDILPLYVEGLCGGYTKSVVDAHTAGCQDCGKLLKDLTAENAAAPNRRNAKKAADPFLKIKRRNRLMAAAVAAVAVVIFAALFVNLFLIGKTASTANVTVQNFRLLDESTFQVELSSNSAFSKINGTSWIKPAYSKGEIYFNVNTVAALPFLPNPVYKAILGFGVGDLTPDGIKMEFGAGDVTPGGIKSVYLVGKDETDIKLVWEQ